MAVLGLAAHNFVPDHEAMWIARFRLASICLVVFALASIFPARASVQDLGPARLAFARGAFAEAAALARPIATAEGLAFAARAAIVEGDFIAPPPERRTILLRAEADARAAIALDPQNLEGHLCLALALGFIGRMDGSLAAHFAGYAAEARAHIDRALALDPNSAWAHALLGGWNLEIVRDGGMIGETIYGASLDQGLAAYARALSLEPDNVAIAYQYALQLIALGGPLHRIEAKRALATALNAKPQDELGRLARRRAQRLKLVLDTRDDAALRAILHEQLGQFENVTLPQNAPRPGNVHPGAIGSPR